MKYEIAQWRASCGVSGSSPACFHALFARALIVEAKNASVAVRPKTRSGPSRPVRALWAMSSLLTTNAIGTARRPAPVLTSTGPLTGSHERSTRITPASKSTLIHRSPRSSPRRSPQNSATAQNARSESGSAARYSWARSGGSILSRRPRIAGRSRLSVGSIEISSRRIARRKMTRSGSRMFAMVEADRPWLAEVVDEVLDVAALDLRQLPAAERRDHIGAKELFIAARGRGLVRLAATVEDRAVVRAGDQDLGRLGDRLRGRRTHRAAAQRDLRVLAPELRGAKRREGAPHLPPSPRVVRLRLVGRLAGAASALARTCSCERDVTRIPVAMRTD